MQVIITTTDVCDLEESIVKSAKIFQIKNNTVKVKGGGKNGRRKS